MGSELDNTNGRGNYPKTCVGDLQLQNSAAAQTEWDSGIETAKASGREALVNLGDAVQGKDPISNLVSAGLNAADGALAIPVGELKGFGTSVSNVVKIYGSDLGLYDACTPTAVFTIIREGDGKEEKP